LAQTTSAEEKLSVAAEGNLVFATHCYKNANSSDLCFARKTHKNGIRLMPKIVATKN